jgi:hypothetical protein
VTTVIRFPLRRVGTILICRERNGSGWLVLHGSHGWLHGDYDAAIDDARWLAGNSGLPIRWGARP